MPCPISSAPSVPRDRIAYVDGLRAVAVLAVVVFHAWQYAGRGGSPVVARLFAMGAHGVDLFFALSGFCLAYPFLRRVRANGSADVGFDAFFAKRLVRIVPPYWLALVVLVIAGLTHVGPHLPGADSLVKQAFFLDGNVTFAGRPYWTLPIEFRWYLVFPLALWAYVSAPRAFALAAAGCAFAYYETRFSAVDVGTLPAFLGGIWLADLELTSARVRRFAFAVLLPCAIVATALEPGTDKAFYAVEPIGVCAILAFATLAGAWVPLRRALATAPFVAIGRASYAIYLVHDPVLLRLQVDRGVAPALAVIAAFAASAAFYVVAERPFVAGPLRDRLVARVTGAVAAGRRSLGLPPAIALTAAIAASPEMTAPVGVARTAEAAAPTELPSPTEPIEAQPVLVPTAARVERFA